MTEEKIIVKPFSKYIQKFDINFDHILEGQDPWVIQDTLLSLFILAKKHYILKDIDIDNLSFPIYYPNNNITGLTMSTTLEFFPLLKADFIQEVYKGLNIMIPNSIYLNYTKPLDYTDPKILEELFMNYLTLYGVRCFYLEPNEDPEGLKMVKDMNFFKAMKDRYTNDINSIKYTIDDGKTHDELMAEFEDYPILQLLEEMDYNDTDDYKEFFNRLDYSELNKEKDDILSNEKYNNDNKLYLMLNESLAYLEINNYRKPRDFQLLKYVIEMYMAQLVHDPDYYFHNDYLGTMLENNPGYDDTDLGEAFSKHLTEDKVHIISIYIFDDFFNQLDALIDPESHEDD